MGKTDRHMARQPQEEEEQVRINPPTGETCRKSVRDLAFMALQRQRSSSGSVHSSNFEGSMDPGTRWERRLRQGTSQTWSPSPGASIPAEEVHPQQATVWWV